MAVYGGIDLHASNSVLAVIDQDGKLLFHKRFANDLARILAGIEPFRAELDSLVVESTFNWYWLVDGLMDAGYEVRLCNPAKADRYDGLKYTDDFSDARWLAEMRRLGILPEGYICPREHRAVRDLLRRRGHLVRQRSALLASNQQLLQRNTGARVSGNAVKQLDQSDIAAHLAEPNLALAMEANVAVIERLDEQIARLEHTIKAYARALPAFRSLRTVAGIGEILALTIALETGTITRFASPGQYASYCRCVQSKPIGHPLPLTNANMTSGGSSRWGWSLAVAYVAFAGFLFYQGPTCTGWVCDLVALPAAFPLGFPIAWITDWIDFLFGIPGHTPTFHFRNWYFIIATVITNAVFYYWAGKLFELFELFVRRLRLRGSAGSG